MGGDLDSLGGTNRGGQGYFEEGWLLYSTV
jgi:hypothetical protein